MTNCVICHKEFVKYANKKHVWVNNEFVCICFECIKKQNSKTI